MDRAQDLIDWDRKSGMISAGSRVYQAYVDDAGNITMNLGELRKLGTEIYRLGVNAKTREVSKLFQQMTEEMVR